MATGYPRWHLEFFFIHVAIPTEEAYAGPHQPAKCAGEGNNTLIWQEDPAENAIRP